MSLNKIKINDVTIINTGVVYDISKATGQTYETLSDALSGNNVPPEVREGGMSVRFVHTGDNKYVQYRLLTRTFSTTVNDWQEYINTEYKSYNYTKNDYTNSLIKEIHIEGTKNPELKYFVRSCMRYRTAEDRSAYFAICTYNPSTSERTTVFELSGITKSGVYEQTKNEYKTTIFVTLGNQDSNDGCLNAVDYAEQYEIKDNCWGGIKNAPIISLYNEFDDYQLLKDSNDHSSFSAFISSVPTDRRNKPTIAVYKNVLYIFKSKEIRQYTDAEWTNPDNWASTNDIPHYERICNIPYVSLFIKDLKLISGNLGENYVYYMRSCYLINSKLYIGIKARNIQDNTEIIAFDNEVTNGYNKIIKNEHVWECVIDTGVKVSYKYTSSIAANDYTEDLRLKDFCFSQTGHLLIDLYNASAEQEYSINSLERSLRDIQSDLEYTVKQQIPYRLVQGYYSSYAEIQYDGSYKSVSGLIPCKRGDVIRFDNFYPEYLTTTMAFWIYDSERHAIGSRVDKNQLTVNDDGIVYYEITREGAAYLGISTNKPDPGALYYAVQAVTDNFIYAIRNNSNIGKIVDVIVFAGQSNMAGRGVSNSTYPEKAPVVYESYGREFRAITDPTKLYPIVDPFGKNENNPNGLDDGSMKTGSLVPAFVNAYYEVTGIPVIAVSATQGALNIAQFQPDGTKLQDVINRFNTCVQYLENNLYTIRHKYVVWCQGENDSSRVSTYESLFENVLNALLAAGAEKVLLIRIGRNSSNTTQDGIVNLQTQMAKTHKDIILISTGFAKYAGEGTMKDTQHFYQFAYNEVGRQAGHNAGCWANYQIERTQYDSMHKVDANIPELYISDKCY